MKHRPAGWGSSALINSNAARHVTTWELHESSSYLQAAVNVPERNMNRFRIYRRILLPPPPPTPPPGVVVGELPSN